MQRLGAEIDRPISFGMIQVDAAPDLWRNSWTSQRQRTPRQ